MALENLNIARVCLHEVHRRADDRTIIAPSVSAALLNLNARGRDAFARRVLSAFRSDAKCMEMQIASYGPESVAARGAAIVDANDAEFVIQSQSFAHALAAAQTSRQHPGGIVTVFDGTVGNPATRFFGVMKAELHEGFVRQNDLQATFVETLFLSPKTKLYKIGLFVAHPGAPQELPNGWTATVFDDQLTASQREGAALYFHESFLGLVIPENSAHQTKQFFHKTREFISAAPMDESEKVDLYNGLYSYLRIEQTPTIQVGEFAERYLPEQLGGAYRTHMRREQFPDAAIQKDLSEVRGKLRMRKFRFRDRITLTGPAEAIREFVEVEGVPAPDGGSWTRITVRSTLQAQE